MFLCSGLAYASQITIGYVQSEEKIKWDVFLVLLIIIFSLFIGLRTSYNDTGAYISGFENSESITEFLADRENLNILHNPLFNGITALFCTVTNNVHLYFLLFAIVDTILFIRFIQRYTADVDFGFAVFLFFGLGTAVFCLAAMKQVTAMAILTLAIPALLDKKWVRFAVIVLIAGLFHTYAFMFLILPFFMSEPWDMKTFLLSLGTIAVMITFNSTISTLLEYTDAVGKSIAEYEVFDGNRMNFMRVAVYAVVPGLTLVFRRKLVPLMSPARCLLANMSIISLIFMLLASMNGANMFGRMAIYFAFGTICLLPWIIKQLFAEGTVKFVQFCAVVLYLIFFIYDNQGFSQYYTSISVWSFLGSLF